MVSRYGGWSLCKAANARHQRGRPHHDGSNRWSMQRRTRTKILIYLLCHSENRQRNCQIIYWIHSSKCASRHMRPSHCPRRSPIAQESYDSWLLFGERHTATISSALLQCSKSNRKSLGLDKITFCLDDGSRYREDKSDSLWVDSSKRTGNSWWTNKAKHSRTFW